MSQLPNTFLSLRDAYPEVAKASDALSQATNSAGPLTEREQQLVRLAFAVAAGLEGATHSHVRRSLEQGLSAEEIRQVALLAMTTLGFPTAVRGYSWISDVLDAKP